MGVHKYYQWEHFKAVVWEIEEDFDLDYWKDLLSEADQQRFKKFKNPKKQREFLSARAALHHLSDGNIELSYSESGSPILADHRGVSISHNAQYCAVILSREWKVAIDLEAFRPKMLQLAERYLSKQERHSIKAENERDLCLAYWSAKETLIKMEDDPRLDLRKEIRISPFPFRKSGMSQGLVRKEGQLKRFPLFFKFEDDYCLCFSYMP